MPALRSSSQSLERGLAILSAFKPAARALGISELARSLELNRSTAHRYVATLARLGYLDQDASDAQVPARPARARSRLLRDQLHGAARDLAPTCSSYRRDRAHREHGDPRRADIVYIERCRSSQPGQREIDLNLHVGSRLPAYCTSMGKVLLAYLPAGAAGRAPRRRRAGERGPNTITTGRPWPRARAVSRATGWR